MLDSRDVFDDLEDMNKMRFSETDRLHRKERAKDRNRIASGQATAEQVQEENSLVPLRAKIKFPHFRSYLRKTYA